MGLCRQMGYGDSVEMIKNMFMAGHATKEQYAQAMKRYHVAVKEMKSHDRMNPRDLDTRKERL